MAGKTLQRSTAHLLAHRRIIVAHAAAAGLAGLLPIPYIDEQLPALVKRAMIRRLAAERHVDLEEDAVREIAEGRVGRPSWRSLVGIGPFIGTARRSVRAAILAYGVYRRAESASRTYALGTLFDHYCARHHVGVGVDSDTARQLRVRIERAIDAPGGGLGAHVFRRGLQGALRATLRAPLELLGSATFGRLRRLRGKGKESDKEVEAEEIVESTIDRSMERERSFLGRAARAIDRQLGAIGGAWVDGLVANFEAQAGAKE